MLIFQLLFAELHFVHTKLMRYTAFEQLFKKDLEEEEEAAAKIFLASPSINRGHDLSTVDETAHSMHLPTQSLYLLIVTGRLLQQWGEG